MKPLRTLIADDEPLARERLRYLLSSNSGVEVAGECRNGKEVIAALRGAAVDLLFLDIQMPGRSGFEVIEQIGKNDMPATVFVTAHGHYAVHAFEVNALDYLTKPVESGRLEETVRRVRERISARHALMTQEQLRAVLSLESPENAKKQYPHRLLIPDGAKDTFVAIRDIDWIEAADYYSRLHVGPHTYMLRETIKQLAQTLDPKEFVRIHRSAIVNISRVKHVIREGRNDGTVLLHNGERLRMSHAGWQALVAAGPKF